VLVSSPIVGPISFAAATNEALCVDAHNHSRARSHLLVDGSKALLALLVVHLILVDLDLKVPQLEVPQHVGPIGVAAGAVDGTVPRVEVGFERRYLPLDLSEE